MKSVRHIYSLLLILMLTGMGCGDDNNGNPIGSGSSTNKPGVPPEPGIGYGVSGLLFNNNLVLYDRARSDLSSFELVLIPQMYFTSIDEAEFPIHGTFPRSQIVSGGVKIDDIPAITNPEMVSPDEIDYVQDNELVIGMALNGESRAYPHNMLWWHEIINDEIGGERISVTFCPLTGSALVFDASMARDRLKMIPGIETTFARWKEMHPDTRVVSASNSRLTPTALSSYPYGNYRSEHTGPLVDQPINTQFPPKRMVHGILVGTASRAYLYSSFDVQDAVNDRFADTDILVVFDRKSRMALSYDRNVNGQILTFSVVNGGIPFRLQDAETGTIWTIEGNGLSGPLAGQTLQRIRTAHNAFWFAWAAFWPNTSVYVP